MAPMSEELVWADVMRPQVPLVYLDLNTIIYIAKALRGDETVPTGYGELYGPCCGPAPTRSSLRYGRTPIAGPRSPSRATGAKSGRARRPLPYTQVGVSIKTQMHENPRHTWPAEQLPRTRPGNPDS
jgi:hypothetical protein